MIAIMIMAHKNISQITRLIKRCVSENTVVFLHLDSEMKISDEDIRNLKSYGVHFTRKRIHGELDKRSLVDITLLLIDAALQYEIDRESSFMYYCLLSGQDYLLKDINQIVGELCSSYPKAYIDCTPYNKSNWVYYKFYSNPSIRQVVNKGNQYRKGSIKRCLLKGLSTYCLIPLANMFHCTDYDRLSKQKINLYGGSAWWILPDKIIKYIHREYHSGKEYVAELLYTFTPEETFFQTIAMKSDYHQLIDVNRPDMVLQNCKTFAFFFDDKHPFKGHPYSLTIEKCIEIIKTDKFYFARKFDEQLDSEVLDYLDANSGVSI